MPDNSNTEVGFQRPRKLGKNRKLLSKCRRRLFKHVWVVRILAVAAVIVVIYLATSFVGGLLKDTKVARYYGLATDFIFTSNEKLESLDGRTNIVLLGKSGEGYDSPELTDTIMFASFDQDNPGITIISLPRDIWLTDLQAKLNSVYYWGNEKQDGGGLLLVKSVVEEIIGQPVHYGAVVDFDGFVSVVDKMGGVEVEVENSFVDEQYPIPGKENDECGGDPEYKCRYETVKFEKGLVLMDGETALKYSRSRNADGDEGTDLARAKRQQKVISAIKHKLLSFEMLSSPGRLIEIVGVLDKTIDTDLGSSEKSVLARKLFDSRNDLEYKVLPEDLLRNPDQSYLYDNLYVFVPSNYDELEDSEYDWSPVHDWVDNLLSRN
jgi:LCP family protein required for cell wall assembly